jgi:DUF971 family protein
MNASILADASLFPQAIVNHQASGVLELRWQDGTASLLQHRLLRARCKCAACQQLHRASGTHPAVAPELRLEGIHPIADKALNLVFSDGHGRGIFPWSYLRELGLPSTT